MESKLTLKLDTDIINQVKKYVSENKGFSLSRLVENYFKTLINTGEKKVEALPPVVASLAGVAKGHKCDDIKQEYTDYLIRKYK